MNKTLFLRALLLGAFLLIAYSPVHADLFQLNGVGDPNNRAEVSFIYSSLGNGNDTQGILDISITNTSIQWDPRITAFAFNLPEVITSVSTDVGSLPTGWFFSFDRDAIDTPGNYGSFDIAVRTGNNFNGGFPNYGIPKTGSLHFMLNLFGEQGLGSLTTESFLDLFSDDPPERPTENPQYFIANFQQTDADGEGSDVAIPPAAVPEPAPMLLLGIGLLGLAGLSRRRFR